MNATLASNIRNNCSCLRCSRPGIERSRWPGILASVKPGVYALDLVGFLRHQGHLLPELCVLVCLAVTAQVGRRFGSCLLSDPCAELLTCSSHSTVRTNCRVALGERRAEAGTSPLEKICCGRRIYRVLGREARVRRHCSLAWPMLSQLVEVGGRANDFARCGELISVLIAYTHGSSR